MTLGQKLKKLRTEKGITQKDLADQLHVTFQTVSKWESDTNEPDIATIKELAKFYDCSFDYLLSDNDESPRQELVEDTNVVPTQEVITKTIIVHQNEAHVCAKCGLDIPEEDLVSEDITKKERVGRTTRTVNIGQTYYHKECLEQVKQERAAKALRERKLKASSNQKKCFGWAIAAGVVGLAIALTIFMLNRQYVHPGLGVLYSVLISYGLFAMLYCILDGSYIGEVFVWCAGLSIKFPGLIFTWDLDGFIWVIAMKILFAILGFLIGVLALMFAIGLSAALGAVSFPFLLMNDLRTDYEGAL